MSAPAKTVSRGKKTTQKNMFYNGKKLQTNISAKRAVTSSSSSVVLNSSMQQFCVTAKWKSIGCFIWNKSITLKTVCSGQVFKFQIVKFSQLK